MLNTQDIRTIAQCSVILFLAKRLNVDVEHLAQLWFKRDFTALDAMQRQQVRRVLDREDRLQAGPPVKLPPEHINVLPPANSIPSLPCWWCAGGVQIAGASGGYETCPVCMTHTHKCANCGIIFDCAGDRCLDLECSICTGEEVPAL